MVPWMQKADAAGAAMREGRQPEAVPTVTISQEQMADFARDVVWDCADPANCLPVVRSTRRTPFPGKRQIDRAALRRVAAMLEWHDTDIVEQVGEGGVDCDASGQRRISKSSSDRCSLEARGWVVGGVGIGFPPRDLEWLASRVSSDDETWVSSITSRCG